MSFLRCPGIFMAFLFFFLGSATHVNTVKLLCETLTTVCEGQDKNSHGLMSSDSRATDREEQTPARIYTGSSVRGVSSPTQHLTGYTHSSPQLREASSQGVLGACGPTVDRSAPSPPQKLRGSVDTTPETRRMLHDAIALL